MSEEERKILEWLIEDIDFSDKRALFDDEHKKELTADQEIFDIFELEEVVYKGRVIIRRKGLTIYFYPLAIQNYLNE